MGVLPPAPAHLPLCHPASSLVITMPAEDNGAILSLHPLHKKQCLLLFLALNVWPYRWLCHNVAARAADCSVGIFPRHKRKWIGSGSGKSRRPLAAFPVDTIPVSRSCSILHARPSVLSLVASSSLSYNKRRESQGHTQLSVVGGARIGWSRGSAGLRRGREYDLRGNWWFWGARKQEKFSAIIPNHSWWTHALYGAYVVM